jgi:hypothetical protein
VITFSAPLSLWSTRTRSANRRPPPAELTTLHALSTGATCTELEAIIAVDKQAIRFDQDKLEALEQYAKGTPDYEEQRQTVVDIEAKIEMQVKKLSEITTAKKCGADEASVTSPLERHPKPRSEPRPPSPSSLRCQLPAPSLQPPRRASRWHDLFAHLRRTRSGRSTGVPKRASSTRRS